MNGVLISKYTFEGLDNEKGPTGGNPSLAYVVGLVNSLDHPIKNPETAKAVLRWLYDVEEQVAKPKDLLSREQEFFARFFSAGYHPLTPCMLAKSWSPIGAMLNRGLTPASIEKESKPRATASAFWSAADIGDDSKALGNTPVEKLFWEVLHRAFQCARQQDALVSIIAKPGWMYEAAIDTLPKWDDAEIQLSGRIIWKRTPEG